MQLLPQALKTSPNLKWAHSLSVALLAFGFSMTANAEEMIPGNGIVTSRQGTVTATDAAKNAISSKARDVILPSGTSWSVDENSRAYLSLSNGVSIGMDSGTQLSFGEYLQRPFDERKQGFEFEPSVSKLSLQLEAGRIIIASNRPSPLSEIRVQLPIGSIRVNKGTCIIADYGRGLEITAIDGSLSYYYPEGENREFLTPENSIRITETDSGGKPIAARKPKEILDGETQIFVEATQYSSQRVFYKANKGTEQAPEPVMIVRPEYFEQPSIRPYQFKD